MIYTNNCDHEKCATYVTYVVVWMLWCTKMKSNLIFFLGLINYQY